MATLREYVELASDVYDSWGSSRGAPDGWMVPAGMYRDDSAFWNTGSSITSSGLQCRAYRRPRGIEAVIAFKGTKPAMASDLRTDVALSFWAEPQQMREALALADTWTQRLAQEGVRSVTLTGHSLGGAIAQYVGARGGKRFVTFNAPGMQANTSGICASPFTAQNRSLGVNYIMWGDPVGNFGRHLGDTVRLNKMGLAKVALASVLVPIVGAAVGLGQHGIGNFASYLEAGDPKFVADRDPLA
jgi:pimeloyl-ACP methyl ester carboxylesterase